MDLRRRAGWGGGAALAVLAIVAWATVAAAQAPVTCLLGRVTGLATIVAEPGATGFRDVIDSGQTVCISSPRRVGERDWVFVEFRLRRDRSRVPVGGWTLADLITVLTPAEAAAFAPPPPPAPPPVASPQRNEIAAPPPAPPPAAAPPPAVPTPAVPPAAVPPPATLPAGIRFDVPLAFGEPPLRGASLAKLIEGPPSFPPVPGLPDDVWRKPCAACHKWTKASLCEHAKAHVKNGAGTNKTPHPFGPAFLAVLSAWTREDCR